MTKKNPCTSCVFDGRIIIRPRSNASREKFSTSNASKPSPSHSAPAEGAASVTVRLRPITRRERNILLALGLLLLVGVAYLAGRQAFPELWPWF